MIILDIIALAIIYSRNDIEKIDDTKIFKLRDLESIKSVIKDFTFFACEKWTIASDKSGSGNTANIGSINKIVDILNGNGVFKNLGEKIFDDYWMNYGKIIVKDKNNNEKKITSLEEFLNYKNIDVNKINPKAKKKKGGKK